MDWTYPPEIQTQTQLNGIWREDLWEVIRMKFVLT